MNKTIIININGTVFHIEEDAYEVLKNYMTDVKRHFLNSDDSLEITTDIENRIAEMFSEILLSENKQVIVEQDVNSVIDQMGRVEEFDTIYEDAKTTTGGTYNYSTTGERRLFRDPDDHLISGVCSGIASYFNIEPLWIRLAFALSFFFAGTGLLVYIILWIVIPKATTRADRMAMKGEKLNLAGFKNNLEEELSAVRGHLNNLHEEARPVVYKIRDFTSDFFSHLGAFFNGAGKIIIKLIGSLILLSLFFMLIALIVLFVAAVAFNKDPQIFPLALIGYEHANAIYSLALLTAGIPLITLIIILISAIFNTRTIGRNGGLALLVIWICSAAWLGYFAVRTAANFKSGASFTQTTVLKATPGNVYYLKFNNVKYLTHDDSLRLDIKGHYSNIVLNNNDDEDNQLPRNVTINIVRSDINQPELVETFSARGSNYEEALRNAGKVKYIYTQQDSVLKFDDIMQRTSGESWHGESLYITLKLPLNSKAIIDRELNDRISLDGLSVRDCNSTDKKDEDAPSATFIMADNGLQCKIDTIVTVKSPAQIDSARKADNAAKLARLQAQVDSVRKADSTIKR